MGRERHCEQAAHTAAVTCDLRCRARVAMLRTWLRMAKKAPNGAVSSGAVLDSHSSPAAMTKSTTSEIV